MGRAGSTLIFNVLKQIFNDGGFIIFNENIKLKNNFLYKTHSFAEDIPLFFGCKVIYTFANPYNVVISAHEYTNIKQHYIHMNGKWDRKEFWHKEDTLRLENNFDSWYKKQEFDLLTIKYETIYQNINFIENFVGSKLKFPKKRERKTNWERHPQKSNIEDTYRILYQKVCDAEDCKIW